jgi:hypothetical protein
MWDIATGGMTMLRIFWDAVRQVDPTATGERRLAGTADGDLAGLFSRAGLHDVTSGTLTARASYAGFDDFWQPFTFAVGPSGQHLKTLSEKDQAAVREACRESLPEDAFELEARAWCARGTVPA